MTTSSALVTPNGCITMQNEDMEYVNGGFWYKRNWSQTGKSAYATLRDGGRCASILAIGGAIAGGAIIGLLATAAGAVGAGALNQWAGAYYDAAASIYSYRNSTSKTVKWYEGLSGLAHLTVSVTSIK